MKNPINTYWQYHCYTHDNFLRIYFILFCFFIFIGGVTCINAGAKTCGSFFLRNSTGDIINPITGENEDQPFSSKKTCGACHDYDLITKGFHFQQGWEKISDSFDKENPWILSDGMMGKH